MTHQMLFKLNAELNKDDAKVHSEVIEKYRGHITMKIADVDAAMTDNPKWQGAFAKAGFAVGWDDLSSTGMVDNFQPNVEETFISSQLSALTGC